MTGIAIVEYDPGWPHAYAREQRRIVCALAGRLVAIEHIGSTSVPGLGAKPIIDIMAGLASLAEAAACMEPLRAIEYDFQPEITAQLGLHDDRLFMKRSPGSDAVNLHLTEYGGSFWREKLLFRDFLRSHPDTAQRYEAFKRSLAPRFSDGPSYSTAKTEFIRAVLEQARSLTVCSPELLRQSSSLS